MSGLTLTHTPRVWAPRLVRRLLVDMEQAAKNSVRLPKGMALVHVAPESRDVVQLWSPHARS